MEIPKVDLEVVIFFDVCVHAEVLVAEAPGEGVKIASGTGLRVENADFEVVAVDHAAEGCTVRRDDGFGAAEELDLLGEGVVLHIDHAEAEVFDEGEELALIHDAAMMGAAT